MSDEARDALRTVVGAARQQLAEEASWGGPDGYDVFTWWQRAKAPLDAVLADLRKHGVTDPDTVLRALRPVVEWAASERATAITALFRRLREQGFRLTKDDHMDITLTDAQRAHVEKLIAANTDTGAEPLTVEQWVQGIVDNTLAKHEQTGQSYG
jgi:hypothetical protein